MPGPDLMDLSPAYWQEVQQTTLEEEMDLWSAVLDLVQDADGLVYPQRPLPLDDRIMKFEDMAVRGVLGWLQVFDVQHGTENATRYLTQFHADVQEKRMQMQMQMGTF